MKNRYQMVNRGSKDSPHWYVEDTWDHDRVLYTNRRRSYAESHLKLIRCYDRERAAKLKQGYHLPGL